MRINRLQRGTIMATEATPIMTYAICQPKVEMRNWAIAVNTRLPPKPALRMPKARPRFLTNQFEIMAVRGVHPVRLRCGYDNSIEEIKVPSCSSHAAEDYTTSDDERPNRYDKPWPESIHEAARHWRHKTIHDDGHREHQCGVASPPPELLYDGGIKDREGVPDGIADH